MSYLYGQEKTKKGVNYSNFFKDDHINTVEVLIDRFKNFKLFPKTQLTALQNLQNSILCIT